MRVVLEICSETERGPQNVVDARAVGDCRRQPPGWFCDRIRLTDVRSAFFHCQRWGRLPTAGSSIRNPATSVSGRSVRETAIKDGDLIRAGGTSFLTSIAGAPPETEECVTRRGCRWRNRSGAAEEREFCPRRGTLAVSLCPAGLEAGTDEADLAATRPARCPFCCLSLTMCCQRDSPCRRLHRLSSIKRPNTRPIPSSSRRVNSTSRVPKRRSKSV